MSDPSDVPPDHLWITTLIARGMARADEEGTAFHRGGLPDATEADRTLHREYLEEAYEVLRGTGRIDELSLMEKLTQGASEKPKKKMTIEEVEAWIAEREAKVSRIEHHLHIWDRGGFEGRDSGWADRARKAVEFTERQIRFGYNMRLSLTRETLVPALEARIGQLETAREADRDLKAHLVGRREAETDALKAFLRERAPHLLQEAYAACDAAVSAFDQARDQTRAPETDACVESVGAACADGTIYAGLSPDGNVPIFATPTDGPATYLWYSGGSTGCSECPEVGVPSTTEGASNTATIASLGASYPAALYCANLNAFGYDDWYLPAQGELAVLYANRSAIGNFRTNMYGTIYVYYWSSTESGNNGALTYRFGDGAPLPMSKSNPLYVRCVRK